jgi:hypothetical protein
MNSVDEEAVAEFLREGGQVQRVNSSGRITEQELLDYLASVGIKARYVDGDSKSYICYGRRFSLAGLERLANIIRIQRKEPPIGVTFDQGPLVSYDPSSLSD